MKKPTIASAVGGIPDLIREGETGLLFPSEDSESFAAQIVRLAEDAALREKLGKALYAYATGSFSDISLAETHIDIYKAVLKDFRDKKKYDVVFSGYYGFHNSGDDALLTAILESLRKEVPTLRALVLSAKPKETRLLYGCDAESRYRFLRMASILGRAHVLLNGGGSLLQDATSSKSLYYYIGVMRLAKRMGAKVAVYANGIGPLKKRNRRFAAKALEGADMVTLRDADSMSEVREMGIEREDVRITADPALLLTGVSPERCGALLTDAGVAEGGYFCVSLLPWQHNDPHFAEKMASAIDAIVQKYGLSPVFVPMKKTEDRFMAQRVKKEMRETLYCLPETISEEEAIGVVRGAEFLIGMRLHALIYAAGGGVPVIGVSYDPKVTGFMTYIGQERILDAKALDTEKLMRYAAEISEDRENIRAALSEKAAALAQKAAENAAFFAQLLKNN